MREGLVVRRSWTPADRWRATWSRLLGRPVSVAQAAWLLVVPGLFLLVPATAPREAVVRLGIPVTLAVLLLARRRVGNGTVLLLLVTGVLLRFALISGGASDVLTVTRSAIERLQAGLDPWGVGYASSVPAGAPFPYGPLALAWYMPFPGDLRIVELGVSLLVLGMLAVRGRTLGLAVYALAPAIAGTATDGSNDTTAGLILLVALLAARRSPLLGGLLLGVAASFKLYAIAWLPGLAIFGGGQALLGFAAASAAAWGPAVLAFGPAPIFDSIRRAALMHDTSASSAAVVVEAVSGMPASRALFEVLRWVGGAVTALAILPFARSWGGFLAGGLAVFVVFLFAGYWSSVSYLAAVAPILCWELDERVGAVRASIGRRRAPGSHVITRAGLDQAGWPG